MIKRPLHYQKLKKKLDDNKIIFVIGPRQAGKTTLLKTLHQELKRSVFFDCQEASLQTFTSADSFLNFFRLRYNVDFTKVKYLFLDEIQSIKNISIILKILHDNYPFKIFASGSGSLEIFRGIQESLIGRKHVVFLYPISFLEFLDYKNVPLIPLQQYTANVAMTYQPLIQEYLLYGGYPEVVTTSDLNDTVNLIQNIYHTYLDKDIAYYIQHKHLSTFNAYYQYTATSIGSLQKIDAIAKQLKTYRKKIDELQFILEHTFVTSLVKPLVNNPKKEVTSHKKNYFIDTGFINSSYGSFTLDPNRMGKLVENFVYTELLKNKTGAFEIYFWRKKSQTEIDFILKNTHTGKMIPIEVKSSSKDVIPKSFKSFYTDYGQDIDYFVVCTRDRYCVREFENTKVVFIPYYYICTLVQEETS